MPGIGGKKGKRGKKPQFQERELIEKEEMQEYGQVVRLFGDSRLEVQCVDGVKRVCHIRGKMRKKIWIAMGDLVLVALREFEDDKGDIIVKYTQEEVRKLKKMEKIPENIKLPSEGENKEKDDDEDIMFVGEETVAESKDKNKNKTGFEIESEDDEEEKDINIDNI